MNIIFKKFGWLTPFIEVDNSLYRCKCVCGKKVVVQKDMLLLGKTRSCGCHGAYLDRISEIHTKYADMPASWFFD